MNAIETVIVIFWFGLAVSFIVAKAVWQAREFHQKQRERDRGKPTRSSLSKVRLGEAAISGPRF